MRIVSTLTLMFLSLSLMFPSVGERNICRVYSDVESEPRGSPVKSTDIRNTSMIRQIWADLYLDHPVSGKNGPPRHNSRLVSQSLIYSHLFIWPPSAPPTRPSGSWPTCPNPRLLRGVHRKHFIIHHHDIGNRPFPVSSETESAHQKGIKLRSGSRGSYSKVINQLKIVNLKKYCQKNALRCQSSEQLQVWCLFRCSIVEQAPHVAELV